VAIFNPVFLERAYSTPDVVEQRARIRAKLTPRRGEHGLDVGCGPGFLVCELASEVGAPGRSVGVDASAEMIATATERARRSALAGRTEFSQGDAEDLHFSSQSFDFVTAIQVYEYVTDIRRALAEAHRVLRPGGRLVVMDSDWDSCIWHVDDRERAGQVLRAWEAHFVHPRLPAEMPGLLAEAGFKVAGGSAVPLLNLHLDESSYSHGMVDVVSRFVSRTAGIPADVAQAWANDVRSQQAKGRYFFSLSRFLFVAERLAAGG
jgi:arsenite methyltransferase